MSEQNRSIHAYDDIIHLSHPVSRTHPQMSMRNRAAQFAPFAALTGYEDAVKESGRLTEYKHEIAESEKAYINERLSQLLRIMKEKPLITITFFTEDEKKDGGVYQTITARAQKINAHEHLIQLDSGLRIPFDHILEIQ